MFPTAGYLRSTNCPFFVHGLCHRPYCHFRHSKPGLKVSKSKISPHKHKTEERHKVGDHVQHASKVTSSNVKTGNSHKAQDEKKDNTSTTTTVKSILKRPNEEISKKSTVEDSSTVDSFDKISTMDISAGTDKNSIESFDDTEQPIASLTDEEKQIIGLMSHPPSMSQNLGFEKSSDAIIAPVSNAISDISSFDSNTCAVSSIQNEAVVSSKKPCNVNLTDALMEVHAEVTDVKKDTAEKALLCSEFKEEMADKVPADSSNDCVMEKHDITVTEEKSDKILSKKRKSVQLKTSTTTKKTSLKGSTKEVSLFDAISKKRKSQQLPCVTDCFSSDSLAKDAEAEVKEFKSLKGNEGCIIQEINTLDQFLKSASKPYQEIERSKKTLSLGKDDTHQDKTFIIPKKQKLVVESTVTLKRKSPVKEFSVENTHIPKKKVQSHVNISEAEINFFSPSKKSHKSSKVEKQKKSPEKTSPVKTSKVIKLEPRGSDKSKDLKQKFSKGVTIMISDDSDAFSPANYDSSSEEESHLKRIWDEYDPQNEFALVEDSPVKSQRQELKRKRTPPAAVTRATADEKQSSMADTLGLRKKQRVAHSANHLPRRTSSNANPIRRYPKTLAAIQKKEESAACSSSMELSVKTATTSYKPTKQRVAHVLKHRAPVGSLPRPRIPVEYGAKVPQNQRQRYLDRIIDEYLRIYPTEKDALEKAVEEEQTLYERSTRRQVYLNLCVNAIKKLRDMKPEEISTTSPVKTEKRVAVTKTLPSGAVVISTKSPVKQDQPVMPASGHLTEDVMCDFLSKYLMSEDDLVENGYPRPSPTSPGKAVFKTNKEQPSKDTSRRICRRCGKPFVVLEDGVYLTKEECVYHGGKLFRRRGEQSYSCCQGDAGTPGCCVGKVHVSDETCNTDGFMTTIVSPLLADQPMKIFAMDCEMCYTTGGLELTRITVVNWNLEGVYDTFVMPERTIVDYNTRFSGVTEELLRGVTTTIREVQAVLLSMIHKDTILVGHSLESDLKATKLIHSKVVDTSVVFPHRLGQPYKRALRNLMADYLKKIIQDSVEGHDSHEDARSCLELMRFKVKEDMKKKTRHKSPRLSLG